jgi:hypothetical protein
MQDITSLQLQITGLIYFCRLLRVEWFSVLMLNTVMYSVGVFPS